MVFGSVAGERGRKKNYIYGSSKAAIHTYLSGLRQKYFNKNIYVYSIIPGFINTKLYENNHENFLMKFLICDPKYLAKIIYTSYLKKKLIVYTPYWKYIMILIKLIPESIFKKLSF